MSPDAAWDFTRRMSPRTAVVCYLSGGKPDFPTVGGAAPTVPWVVYLTDSNRRFRLLCFDFDAKDPGDPDVHAQRRAAAAHDAARLAGMLTEFGIEHVVCASGPSGGRHVWVAMRNALPGDLVSRLAYAAHEVMPSLDKSPLTNCSTGGVRPPGAPHRHGGHSVVIAGDPAVLAAPSTTREQIEGLAQLLDRLAPPPPPLPPGTTIRLLAVDDDLEGQPWIPGARRALSTHGWTLAREPIGDDAGGSVDASSRLFAVLCSAARAHWTISDVRRELAHLPGLEHLRTTRGEHSDRVPRTPRGAASPGRVLVKNWRRAVEYLADNSTVTDELEHEDPDFDRRAAVHAAAIAHMQQRADVCFGRWARPGGAKDRLVLDALCRISIDVIQPVVGAAIRTVATMTGISRESACRSLHNLQADGWIELATESAGTHAALWRLLPYGRTASGEPAPAPTTTPDQPAQQTPSLSIHREPDIGVSLGATAPRGEPTLPETPSGSQHRRSLLALLTNRLELAAHDAFTARRDGGLGGWTALVYSRLTNTLRPPEHVFPASTPPDQLHAALEALYGAGLLSIDHQGQIARTDPTARDSYAEHVGTAGTLTERAEQYELEQQLWAWWVDEAMWMSAGGRRERTRHHRTARRRPNQHTLALATVPSWADRPAYPRQPGGRRDHRAARTVLTRGS